MCFVRQVFPFSLGVSYSEWMVFVSASLWRVALLKVAFRNSVWAEEICFQFPAHIVPLSHRSQANYASEATRVGDKSHPVPLGAPPVEHQRGRCFCLVNGAEQWCLFGVLINYWAHWFFFSLLQEVAAVLIAFEHHKQWQSLEVKPRSGPDLIGTCH